MAILFVTHKFPPAIGGMQKQSYELINGVQTLTDVHVIAQRPSESKAAFFVKLRGRIKKALKQHPGIHTIHCNDGVMAACVALFCRFEGLNYSCTFHGLDLIYPNSIYQNYILPKISTFSSIICVSEHTRRECIRRGFDPAKVHTIVNGVDFDLQHLDQRPDFESYFYKQYGIDLRSKKTIVSIGRAVKRKGMSWFANTIMPKLPENVQFVMVGPIEKKGSFLSKIFKMLPHSWVESIQLFTGYASDSQEIHKVVSDVDKKSIHVGRLPFMDMMQLLSYADVFIMPNIKVHGDMEGFGLVALEANLRGCPVVVSSIEGITSAVRHGKNGFNARSEDVEDWYDKLDYVLSEEFDRKAYSSHAEQYVLQNFSWDNMAEKYFNIFSDPMTGSAIHRRIAVKDINPKLQLQ